MQCQSQVDETTPMSQVESANWDALLHISIWSIRRKQIDFNLKI
jgi:hypothetical protein